MIEINNQNKEFKSFFKSVKGGEGDRCNYPTRLDMYGCGCSHDCSYCLDPDTLILMYDGSSKKIKDLEIGDEIYGVEKESKYHKYVKSIVLNKWNVEKPSFEIVLENGTKLICSADHKWLSNRGWKYTIGEETGVNRRPFLTTNNNLLGFGLCLDTSIYKETDNYKKGYLFGIIKGDGHLKEYNYNYKRRKKDIQYHFRLALKKEEAIVRTKEYLSYFNIDTNYFEFKMTDKQTKDTINTKAIRTDSKENFNKIVDLIKPIKNNSEFLRGFLAGFYDAEGSKNKDIKRVFNTDIELLNLFIAGLNLYNFKYKKETTRKTINNKQLYTIRIIGGISEFLRFLQITNPAIKSKFSFKDIHVKNINKLKVKSIKPYKDKQVLYDITTSTENFIANGIISHNCYAKSLLSFRKLWNSQNPSVADINKIKRVIDKKIEPGSCVRLGGMTDCFQPIEVYSETTYNTIKELNKKGIHYLIVTKSALVAEDKYIKVMDKHLAHIQISITTTSDEKAKEYEKASLPSERIKAIEKLQANGFDVQLRLSPFIPEYIDFDILNNIKCDKILIEFLRVNSWIKKWFDIDYSNYTLKEGGYNHLPLEKKLEYINKIKNFKEKSVCEDVNEHYEYWKNNFNYNKEDCCNLNIKK